MIRKFAYMRAAMVVVFGLTAFVALAAPRYCVEMTTSGYAGMETLANFPVLVKFAKDAPAGFDYSQFQPGQADLSFEDASGNKLAYEIDTWDEEGTSFVWVKVPELTAATKIVAKWGDPEATADRGSVWSAAGYAGVWHMGETENQGTEDYVALDASGNGMTAEPMMSGTTDFTPMVSKADGAVGRARVNQSAADRKICLKVDGYKGIAAEIAEKGTLAVSGWFNVGGNNSNARLFAQKKYWSDADGFEIQQNGSARTGGSSASVNGAFGTLTAGQWYHVAFVLRGAEASSVYLNGVEKKSGVLPALVVGNYPLTIGNNGNCSEVNYVGSYDEVRLLKGAVPNDWVKAEYDTVKNAAFYESSAVIDAGSFDTFTVETEIDAAGTLVPAVGVTTDLTDGETVSFSAPEAEFPHGDGYLVYTGYRLYVTVPGEAEKLVREVSELSGSYTHVADQSARLVWKQAVRKGGASFETGFASIVQVPGYTADETLRNMQVLFRLKAGMPEGFSYADCQANGADILFTDADGHVVPHEIEKWNPEGESLIWVNLPKLAKGTTFRFCYGNASVEEPAPAANVWSDGFAGVWHLDETGTAAAAIDATGRGNDGVATTKSTGGLDEMTAESDGAICGARRIGISKTNYYQTPSSTAFNLGQSFTVSAWIRGTGRGQSRIIGHKSGWNTASGWEILWSTATTASPRGSGGDTERARSLGNSATTWTHVVWVFNGAAVSTYSNGVKSGDDSVITPVVDTTRALEFGGTSVSQDYFGGSFDEVRIMGGAANALRVKADYDTVTSAEFLSAAPARQSAGADVLTVISSGREIGTVTPDWGEHTGLADGQVIPFSAPAEEQVESEDVHFVFTGYSLYSTGTDGTERLIETRDATSGTYTHVGGTTARLVWRGNDLFRVSAETNHGTVVGCGYVRLGGQVTLRAVADEGYRFSEWVGDAVPDELRESPEITLTVSGVTPLVARFTVKPSLAAFWDFKEGAAGSPVTATANAKGPESFSGSGAVVENASGAGLLPVYSAQTPGFKVYSDATCAELLADRPQSVRFGANDLAHGGGEVTIAGLGSWISRQDVCTVEFFCRGDVYRASRAAFSLDVGNDPNALYYPAGSAAAILFSCETDRAGHKGGVSPAGEYGFSPSYDAWHHVAVVYSRERQVAKVYLDRVYKTAEKSVAIVEQEDGGVPLRLGSAMANNAAANCFSGYIACLRVSVGELVPADFMCAAPSESEGDTLAFYSLRGRKGDAVKTVSPVLGCSRLTGEARLVDGKDAPIVYSDDVPGAALYDGEAGLASGVPLARRISSVDIRNVEDGDSADDAASVLDFYDMSTELSSRDAFTIEFFAKFDGAGTWRAVTAYNISGGTMGKTGVYVDMPYSSASLIGIVGGASVSVPSLHENRVWHHLAFTYDKTSRQMKFYVDYSKSPASFGLKTAPTAASLVFGGDTGKSRAFRGKIAGVRISTRALTPSEFLIAAPRPDSGFILLLK